MKTYITIMLAFSIIRMAFHLRTDKNAKYDLLEDLSNINLYRPIANEMLNQMNKYTLRYQFNQLNHRLHILTNVKHNVIMEAYANIPQENLFKDDLFFKYVTGYCKQQLGNLVGRYDYTLPGGVKINAADLVSQGKEEVKEVEEEIKGQSTSSWFYMVKR